MKNLKFWLRIRVVWGLIQLANKIDAQSVDLYSEVLMDDSDVRSPCERKLVSGRGANRV